MNVELALNIVRTHGKVRHGVEDGETWSQGNGIGTGTRGHAGAMRGNEKIECYVFSRGEGRM
jgi:hypothetical protein